MPGNGRRSGRLLFQLERGAMSINIIIFISAIISSLALFFMIVGFLSIISSLFRKLLDKTTRSGKMSTGKTSRLKVSALPSVSEVHSQLNKSGKAIYLDHTIRVSSDENTGESYIIEGKEITYCEFRKTGLALVLIYLQRMLIEGV
jgi:hypothetical protein